MFIMVLKTLFTLVVGALIIWIEPALASWIAAQMFVKFAPAYTELANAVLIAALTYHWIRAVIQSIEVLVSAVRKYFAIRKATEEKRAEYESWLKRHNVNVNMKQYRKPTDKS